MEISVDPDQTICSGLYVQNLKRMYFTSFFRHFEGFLGCIKFHALLNGETCPIKDLESMVRENTTIGQFSICTGKLRVSVDIIMSTSLVLLEYYFYKVKLGSTGMCIIFA